MTELREGNVVWSFPDTVLAMKYDDWTFYRSQFQGRSGGGTKAVDFVALDTKSGILWLIEVKDYTFTPRDEEKIPLEQEVALKARDSLAGLFAARANATGEEQDFAKEATATSKIRLVLHVEQPTTTKRSYGSPLLLADLQQQIKLFAKAIDPHPKVMDSRSANSGPWRVRWEPPAQ